MKPHSHVVVSAVAGAILWAATDEPVTLGVTVAAGVLPDSDHVLDYYNWYVRRRTERMILLFHGWEYLAVAIIFYALIFREPWMLGIAVGYGTQIAGDQISHRASPGTYFLLYRASARFRWESLTDSKPADTAYRSLVASVPLFRTRVTNWFRGRLEPE